MLSSEQKKKLIKEYEDFFCEVINNHRKNILKLKNPKEFSKFNPFLLNYLSTFFEGSITAEGIARMLIYPRILSTSINTSFGTNFQKFLIKGLKDVFGSGISGIDLEFTDAHDKRKKYCQLKSGPNTINSEDVKPIFDKFKNIKNLAKTNHLNIETNDLIIGVSYGTKSNLSANYKKLEEDYFIPIYVGEEFWYRLTGDPDLYKVLLTSSLQIISSEDVYFKKEINQVIDVLSKSDFVKDIVNGNF